MAMEEGSGTELAPGATVPVNDISNGGNVLFAPTDV